MIHLALWIASFIFLVVVFFYMVMIGLCILCKMIEWAVNHKWEAVILYGVISFMVYRVMSDLGFVR